MKERGAYVARNDVFYRLSKSAGVMPCFVFASACLVTNQVMADALPPPSVNKTINQGFPSAQKMTQMGYDSKTGTLTVSNNGGRTVTVKGDTVTGTQGKTISAKGGYGETGKINTTVTQTVSGKALTAAAAASVGADADSKTSASRGLESARNSMARGDYIDAAIGAGQAAWNGLSSLPFVGGALGDAGNAANQASNGYADIAAAAQGAYNAAMSRGASGGGSNGATTGADLGVGGAKQGNALGEAAAAAKGAQAAAMSKGDFGGAAAAAATAKGAAAAAKAASVNGALDEPPKDEAGRRLYPGTYTFTEVNQKDPNDMKYVTQVQGYAYAPGITSGNNITKNQGEKGTYNLWAGNIHLLAGPIPTYTAKNENSTVIHWGFQSYGEKIDVKKEDLALNQSEIEDILKQMLANQNANHEALMNQLAGMAAAGGGTTVNNTTNTNNNTTTNIGDSLTSTGSTTSPAAGGQSVVDVATTGHTNTGGTALSEPYTPAGTNQAQQTQWTLNPDGSVTATTIPRPDLQPNSSQAPTKAPSTNTGQNTTGQNPATTGQTPSQQQQDQQKSQCELTPNAAMCQELGEENGGIELGQKTINLNFSPADIFNTDGECPASRVVNLGQFGTVQFSYEQLCYFFRLTRPFLIMLTMLACAWAVFGAIERQR